MANIKIGTSGGAQRWTSRKKGRLTKFLALSILKTCSMKLALNNALPTLVPKHSQNTTLNGTIWRSTVWS